MIQPADAIDDNMPIKACEKMQIIGHVIIERRAQARAEIIEKDKAGRDQKLTALECRHEAVERGLQALHVDRRLLLLDQEQRAENHAERRRRDDGGGRMQRARWRKMLHELARSEE